MKYFLFLFCLFAYTVNGHADTLPVNAGDRKNEGLKHPVYARLTIFNNPQPEANGAIPLAQFSNGNEETSYFIKGKDLYINVGNMALFRVRTDAPVPQLEQFLFINDSADDFAEESLKPYQVPNTDGRSPLTLYCSPDKSKKVVLRRACGVSFHGEASDCFYLVTFYDNGKERRFTRRDCPVRSLDAPPGLFAYCGNDTLYYDGYEYPKKNNVEGNGIYFCDLKRNIRGPFAVEEKGNGGLSPYNPVGIPGTGYILYLEEGPNHSLTRMMVRPELTPRQAKKLAFEKDNQ